MLRDEHGERHSTNYLSGDLIVPMGVVMESFQWSGRLSSYFESFPRLVLSAAQGFSRKGGPPDIFKKSEPIFSADNSFQELQTAVCGRCSC